MVDSAKGRLVRCPRCKSLLPELTNYSVYQCGGCGAVLQGKHKGYGSGSLSEKSNEGKVGGDSGKSDNSLGKGLVDSNDSDFGSKSNRDPSRHNIQRDSEKANNGRKGFPSQSEKMSNWKNEERSEMEGFGRKPRIDMESMRFSTNYPDEGTSNSYSSFSYNHVEPWKNHKEIDGANRVQHLEQDRTALLRKLDELKDQLKKSSEAVKNPKEKFHPNERMVPPDPYGGSDPWFPNGSSRLNRTSRQLLGTDKHDAGPSYLNYLHDPYAYSSDHVMTMTNFHPSMHNPNHIHGCGDPFASQMLRRGPHQLTHQFPQQPLYPHFPEGYLDTNPDIYEPYAHNAMLHLSSCSCFHCYDYKRGGSVSAPPAPFINSRFPDNTTNDPMLSHHEILGALGPNVHSLRNAIPPMSLREKQSHTRTPSDFNSEMGGLVGRRWKVMLANGRRHCRPIAGGSPFIICHNCFKLLQLPTKALAMVKNHQQKVRCGACSSEISFAVINKKLVISPHQETKGVSTRVDGSSNEVVSSHPSHSRGHVNRSGVNLSSYDYSGYGFSSIDREPLSLDVDPSLNSKKSQKMQSFHSWSRCTSEDENSQQVKTAPREATKSPPPAGSPLQEYHSSSNNNNHAVNQFGKGNRSSCSEQENAKIDRITSREISLKGATLATEMDVHDYSNTSVSHDSRDANRGHDYPRSNRNGESFFANIIKKSFRDFSKSNQTGNHGKINVTVNGQPISDRVIKKAEKLAGPIQPGNYWYDFQAGFWGVMGGPCLGIIPSSIEEFNHPLPDKCSCGNTGVFVNGRELHQNDLDMLFGRGLPTDTNRSYIIEISGRVLNKDTGEELDSLGKLAPTVEKVKHGFGMKVPRAAP